MMKFPHKFTLNQNMPTFNREHKSKGLSILQTFFLVDKEISPCFSMSFF